MNSPKQTVHLISNGTNWDHNALWNFLFIYVNIYWAPDYSSCSILCGWYSKAHDKCGAALTGQLWVKDEAATEYSVYV